MILAIQSNNTPQFGKFIKIKGKKGHLEHFRKQLRKDTKKDFVTFIRRTPSKKSKLYILSGKDLNKFIDYARTGASLIDFRHRPENFLNTSPISMRIHEAYEQLKKRKLL